MDKEYQIIYESNQLLIINKPGGIITEYNEFEEGNMESIYLHYLKDRIKHASQS